MAMEVLTYGKLIAASDQLPPDVVNTWQAPQALKALLEFQDLAAESFSVSVAELPEGLEPTTKQEFEGLDWLALGDHHALSLAWLKNNYNKVGGMLHAQPPADSRVLDFKKMASDLRNIAAEVQRAVESSIISVAERGGLVFTCGSCGKPVIRNHEELKRGETARCFTAGCDAEYTLVKDGGDPTTVTPILASFPCTKCNGVLEFHHRKLKSGDRFACSSCGTRHVIGPQTWRYGALLDEGGLPAANASLLLLGCLRRFRGNLRLDLLHPMEA